MVITILHLHLFFPESQSLKDKRSVLKGLKDRLKSRFNISLLETDHQDTWQRSSLSIALLADTQPSADSLTESIKRTVETDVRLILTHAETEYK